MTESPYYVEFLPYISPLHPEHCDYVLEGYPDEESARERLFDLISGGGIAELVEVHRGQARDCIASFDADDY